MLSHVPEHQKTDVPYGERTGVKYTLSMHELTVLLLANSSVTNQQ